MDNILALSSSAVSEPSKVNEKITWKKAESKKQQLLSLPDSVIYYTITNPSAQKVYLKLAESCKYFFEKNPLLIVHHIYGDGRKFCSNDGKECNRIKHKCCIQIDLTKITFSKIWLTYQLILSEDAFPNIASLIVPKIYRCENVRFCLSCKTINMEDFKLFSTIFQIFFIYRCKIVDHDGNNVMLEDILEVIPTVTYFNYTFDNENLSATTSTMKNISKLQNLGNLRKFYMQDIPGFIGIADFSDIVNNQKYILMKLHFKSPLTSQEYKRQYDELGDALLPSKTPNCSLRYYGQNDDKYWMIIEKKPHQT